MEGNGGKEGIGDREVGENQCPLTTSSNYPYSICKFNHKHMLMSQLNIFNVQLQ